MEGGADGWPMAGERARAAAWFGTLRDRIVLAVEGLERGAAGGAEGEPGRFQSRATRRSAPDGGDAGGGVMMTLRDGRVVEKMGVGVSTVHGTLGAEAQRAMAARGVPGIEGDPRFWASGISLVCHPRSPRVPAVHLNTRMFWTHGAWWFGGGTDLNPAVEFAEDTAHFHAALEAALAPWPGEHARQRAWADEYFFVPHRGRARGVGGTFLDDHCSGDWEADFAMIRAIGEAFLPAWLPLAEGRAAEPWGAEERERQLVHRGLYAEFNLVYDRGTRFGLASGHDAEAVLMSLPPLARWP